MSIKQSIKTLALSSLITLSWTPMVQAAETAFSDNGFVVAYYGRPGVPALGVLGQHSPEELGDIIKAKANEYSEALGGAKVTPGFDIIFDLASSAPGPNGDYIIHLSEDKLEPYLQLAEEQGFLVFLDMQLGKLTPAEAVRPVLKYLKHPNVHLAIDPEFEVKGLNVAPGKRIGQINGPEINAAMDEVSAYIRDNQLNDKILIVHMFRHKMVEDKSAVQFREHDNIQLVMNLDGHGSPHLKVDIYNAIYNSRVPEDIVGGFKLFFKEDKPRMMTPKEVLGQESVDGVQVKKMPRYIDFQ